MVTIGDTMAILGVVFGVCISTWAALMGFTTLFGKRTDLAATSLQQRPWKCAAIGIGIWLPAGFLTIVLMSLPLPGAKLAGLAALMVLLAFTTVGASGLSQLIGRRLRAMDSQMSEYGGVSRGSLIVVTSCIMPLIGWFAVVPTLLALGMGAGVAALFNRHSTKSTAAPGFEFGG